MLCKCSGKYIDIYFNLKITFSFRFYLVSFCLLFLLVCSFCLPFLLLSVPFSFPVSFVVSLLHLFLFFFRHLLLPFLFLPSSSLCLRLLCSSSSCLVSCSPFFSLLLLSFFLSIATTLSPPYPPLFLSLAIPVGDAMWFCTRSIFFFFSPSFFRHDFVRTISLEPSLVETPN